jgi:uncharacterized protein YdeI (YjbR/CyaY-like superfamily)
MSSPTTPGDGLPVMLFETQADFEAWLDAHHASASGAWLRLAKKAAGLRSLSYDAAVEAGLCFGWIDGQKKGYDERSWLQRFTPRGPQSIWSKVNRAKAEALLAAGRMRPAGLAAVERARQTGRWDAAYDPASTATVPEDLQAALDASERADAFFKTLSGANRYALLFRIQTAKKPETRARRIQEFIDMLERGEKFYP